MFDFPDTPTTGQVYSSQGVAWQYDGEKWKGGAPATQQSEFYYDASGKTAQDIPVPTWARSCELEGYAAGMGARMFCMRYSADGTTFPIGASDYSYYGPHHATGSNLYQTQSWANATLMYLTYQGDNAVIPHHFVANISLTRPDTAKALGMFFSQAQMADSLAAYGARTTWLNGYMAAAAAGSNLSVKVIRITNDSGTALPTGTWFRVKFSGDLNAVPQSGAIVDAPSDGAEYVRVNGVWRKKCETLTWSSSITTQKVICPVGATRLRAVLFVSNPSVQASGSLGFQGSQDGGNTFVSAANSYYYSGIAAEGGSPAVVGSVAVAGTTYGYLGWLTNNTSVGNHTTLDLLLQRPASGSTWLYHCFGGGYYDPTANAQRTWVINGYLSAGWGAGPINALQFFNANSTMLSGSIECTWGYG